MSSRRGFLGSLAALAMAPFVPTPKARPCAETVGYMDASNTGWSRQRTFEAGDIITISGTSNGSHTYTITSKLS